MGYFQLGTWFRTEGPKLALRGRNGRLRPSFLKRVVGLLPPELFPELKEWALAVWAPAYRAQKRGDLSLAKAMRLPGYGPQRPKYENAGLDRYGVPVLLPR